MQVASLGDLVLDVVVRARSDVARGADTPAHVSLSAGGQGANVAAWAAALGASSRWVGKRADDAQGRLAAEALERAGVELAGPVEADGNGVIVSLVDATGERSMFPDRGVATLLEPVELRPAWFVCDHLHVSGYALLAEPVVRAAVRAIDLARVRGARISVDLSSWSAIRDAGTERFRRLVESLEPDVVFANEEEDEIFGGRLPGVIWILKRGDRGCSFDGEERVAVAVPRVVDTTGAGDALAAGWIVGGPDLALGAAARCVQRMGSMPDPTEA
ncbi:MAG TPA: carbohydrate kinase family protein [Gaiella sp.]|nr:carbohydrate kinase family protein [Gaiella sp.]